jgi:hypothetical protein
MNRLPLLVTLALSFCTANAWSQQTGADAPSTFEVPSGPLPHPAPNFSQWTITYSYSEEQTAKDSDNPSEGAKLIVATMGTRPRTIVTTKTGEIIREETTTIGANQQEDWQVHGSYYIKYPGKSFWSAYERSDPSMANSNITALTLPPSGFRGLDWINKQTYVGRMKTEWGDCLIFAPGGQGTVKGDLTKQKLDAVPTIAYLDAETRLPVMARAGDETRVFQFTQAPTSLQTLPEDLASEIKAGDALRAQRNAAPQKEY